VIVTHDGSHGMECFGCRVKTVAIAPSATPTRAGGAKAAEVNARESRWNKDMPAYKRLRREGVQPERIDGAAGLERKLEATS